MKNYIERTYRNNVSSDRLVHFPVKFKETDLFIGADLDLSDIALQAVFRYRGFVEQYIEHNPQFSSSLTPLPFDKLAPAVIRDMLRAARITGVGPMASVAGAIAESVGKELLQNSSNIIVENGGDIFLSLRKDNSPTKIGIFAGESVLSYKVSLKIKPDDTPTGVCTSSGTIGHSLSLGKADAVCVVSDSTAVADAAATSICNRVKTKSDINEALEYAQTIEFVNGVVIIVKDKIGAWGAVELC